MSELGAEQVIDYRAVRFEEHIPAVNVVFDTVGGEALRRSWNSLKPYGRMITIAAGNEAATDERIKQAFFIVEPIQQQLAKIGRLLEEGRIQAAVDAVLPLNQAPDAFTGKVQCTRGRGKLVVAVGSPVSPRQPL